MAENRLLTYEQVYIRVKNGDAAAWNEAYEYILLNPNDLFRIANDRVWSLAHQIVYHGKLILLQNLLILYNDRNPVNIQLKSKDKPTVKTILDVANDRRTLYKDQYEYIKHLFDQDKFIQACKVYDWVTIDNMLESDRSLLNEKPPYASNYFIHYLVLYQDVRKYADYCLRSYQFQLDLKNVDGKTALDLARENNCIDFVNEFEQLSTSEVDETRDEREENREEFIDYNPTTLINSDSSIIPVSTLPRETLRKLTCIITNKIFVDPVIANDGKTYERQAILEWLFENRTSPQTGEPMDDTLRDDITTKNIIINFRRQNLLP